MYLFLLLVGVPLIEIILFIQVGGWIGLWPTILLVILTAMLGASMLRNQGLAAMRRLQTELETGGDPSPLIVHGAMLLFAGALLLTPGFLTDAIGFTLLIPRAREAIIAWARPRMVGRVVAFGAGRAARPTAAGRRGRAADQPIEAEYEVVEDDTPRPRR